MGPASGRHAESLQGPYERREFGVRGGPVEDSSQGLLVGGAGLFEEGAAGIGDVGADAATAGGAEVAGKQTAPSSRRVTRRVVALWLRTTASATCFICRCPPAPACSDVHTNPA
jgi:hypothetical protein